jgi:hypothetical protein
VGEVSAGNEATTTLNWTSYINTGGSTSPGVAGPLAFDPTSKTLYVDGYDAQTGVDTTVLAESTGAVVTTLSGLGGTDPLFAADPATSTVYGLASSNTSSSSTWTLSTINASTNAVVSSTTISGLPAYTSPTSVTFDASTGVLYAVSNSLGTDDELYAVNVSTGALVGTLSLSTATQQTAYPPIVAVDAATNIGYVTSAQYIDGENVSYVYKVSLSTLSVQSTFTFNAAVVSVGLGPTSSSIYVAELDAVAVVDSTTGLATSTYSDFQVAGGTMANLSAMAIDTTTGNVLVADPIGSVVYILAPGSGTGSIVGANPPPGTATSPIDPGVLSFVSTPSNLTFPALTLDGTNETTSAALPLDVGDNTGSGAGWNVTITSTQFSSGSATLPASATSVNVAPSASCDAGVSCTPATLSSSVTYPITVPAGETAPTATRLYSAAAGTGMGDQTISPDFTLAVPANAASGSYSSDWTLSLVSGP